MRYTLARSRAGERWQKARVHRWRAVPPLVIDHRRPTLIDAAFFPLFDAVALALSPDIVLELSHGSQAHSLALTHRYAARRPPRVFNSKWVARKRGRTLGRHMQPSR
jgi:hypothetical protein